MDLQQVKQRFGIIGNSAKLNYALQTAMRVAPTELTVYIQGESGSGKESFSKIIHHLSPRKHGPFIAINCGALPEGTINSELFGHDKGAFTGARSFTTRGVGNSVFHLEKQSTERIMYLKTLLIRLHPLLRASGIDLIHEKKRFTQEEVNTYLPTEDSLKMPT